MKSAIALLTVFVVTLPAQAQTFGKPNSIQNFAQTYCTLRRGGLDHKKAFQEAFANMGMDLSDMVGNVIFSRKKTREVLRAAVIGTCPEVLGYPTQNPPMNQQPTGQQLPVQP